MRKFTNEEATNSASKDDRSVKDPLTKEELEIRYQKTLMDLQDARDLNRKYQLILEEVNDGYWELDLYKDEFTLRSKYYRSHGVIPTLIIQGKEKWQELIHPEDRKNFHQALEAFLDSDKKIFKFTHRLKTREEEYRWVLATGFGLRDEMGIPKRIMGTHTPFRGQGVGSGIKQHQKRT